MYMMDDAMMGVSCLQYSTDDTAEQNVDLDADTYRVEPKTKMRYSTMRECNAIIIPHDQSAPYVCVRVDSYSYSW